MIRRENTCCFTGHRSILSSDREEITRQLEKTIVELIHVGIDRFIAGGARGFDYEKRTVMRSEIHKARQ